VVEYRLRRNTGYPPRQEASWLDRKQGAWVHEGDRGTFRQLAEGPEQNEIVLRRGDEESRLSAPDQATFKLGVKEPVKKSRIKRQLELTPRWQKGGKKRDLVQLA